MVEFATVALPVIVVLIIVEGVVGVVVAVGGHVVVLGVAGRVAEVVTVSDVVILAIA